MWRKVQSVGLSIKYGEDEEFSLLVRHLLALAFLPAEEIPSAFDEIKKLLEIESGAEHLIMWFEDNYVLGRVRKTQRNGNVIRGLPLFSPELWSVFNQNILFAQVVYCDRPLVRMFATLFSPLIEKADVVRSAGSNGV